MKIEVGLVAFEAAYITVDTYYFKRLQINSFIHGVSRYLLHRPNPPRKVCQALMHLKKACKGPVENFDFDRHRCGKYRCTTIHFCLGLQGIRDVILFYVILRSVTFG